MDPADPSAVFLDSSMGLAKRHHTSSNNLDPLTLAIKEGLIPVALCAMLSLISLTGVLAFITKRLIFWRKHYKEYVGYNQNVILIYNLLLADLQQSIAFSISFHWLRINKIVAPNAPCFIQAWFMHLGDVSSGFFVLAIAIHTWMGVVKGYTMPYRWFVVCVLLIWLAAFILTVMGPAIHGVEFFGRAAGWCWVAGGYENERLYLHYLWIFVCEFGTVAIYSLIFIHLRGHVQSIIHKNSNNRKLSRATKFMVLYPAVYVILTLPIAVGRMMVMTGTEMSDTFFCIVGALLTSCGWIDALLYTLTRRVLVSGELSSGQHHPYSHNVSAVETHAARPGDDVKLQPISKEDAAGRTRTVTITGGGGNRLTRLVNHRDARGAARIKSKSPNPLRSGSPTGSQDSIIKGNTALHGIGIIAETSVQVDSVSLEDGSDRAGVKYSLHSRNGSASELSIKSLEEKRHA